MTSSVTPASRAPRVSCCGSDPSAPATQICIASVDRAELNANRRPSADNAPSYSGNEEAATTSPHTNREEPFFSRRSLLRDWWGSAHPDP